ncbi:MAG: cytochrome c family protein [Alphaproteobacteria bacterium]|nr:cytochrome c family protein [Alphaproteobacteria bacterium]
MRLLPFAAAAALLASHAAAFAQGDPAKGEAVFKRCAVCHEVNKTKNKVGPHLVGIVGRKAGVVEDYKYSKSLMEKAAEGLVWDKEALDKYLEKPKALIPQGKMAFAGLRNKADRDNVIAYLEKAGKAE